MPAPERLDAKRIVASEAALAGAGWDSETIVMRIAPDEALVLGPMPDSFLDPHAIVEDEEGFVGARLTRRELDSWMERESEWRLPPGTDSFTQGMVAGLPVKVWVAGEHGMVVTRVSLAAELEARL